MIDSTMPVIFVPLQIITADEVAKMLDLDRKSVYTGAAAGEIPCKRVGRRFIFCRQTIEVWLADATTTADKITRKLSEPTPGVE